MSDSEQLFRLADRLDEQAALARERAGRLLAGSGPGAVAVAGRADAFRARASATAGGMQRSAAGLESAAQALRRHARAVRQLEELAELAAKAATAAVDGLVNVGHHLLHLGLP